MVETIESDNDEDEFIVTNFSELRTYIKKEVIHGNWLGFKEYIVNKKESILNLFKKLPCKKASDIHAGLVIF